MTEKEKKPRRKSLQLTKAEAKDMALDIVAGHLEGTSLHSMVDTFTSRIYRKRKRPPTQGEKDIFIGEVSKIVESLKSRKKGKK